MKRFVEGVDRSQSTLFPGPRLDDWIGDDNPVRVVDIFVDELDLGGLGISHRVEPQGRPGQAFLSSLLMLLKLYIYGLSEPGSVEPPAREGGRAQCGGDVAGRAAGAGSQDDRRLPQGQRPCDPQGLRPVRRAVPVQLGLFAEASVAIDGGSKFKAVNSRDRNFTRAKMARRVAQIEESVARYLDQLDSADRQEPIAGSARPRRLVWPT